MNFLLWRLESKRIRVLFVGVTLLLLGFLGVALLNGFQFSERYLQNAEQLTQQHQSFVQKQAQKTYRREKKLRSQNKPLSPDKKTYRNPAWLAQKGPTITYPEPPLLVLSQGNLMQGFQAVELSWKPTAVLKHFENLYHPLQRWWGALDWVFVWVYIWPLLVIALCFDLYASDREQGSLRLLYVQRGRLLQPLLSRAFHRLALCLGLLWGTHVALIGFVESFAPLGWIVMLLSLYTLFWWGLCLLVNTFIQPARHLAALLVIVWLLFSWWVPAGTQQVLAYISPPSEPMAFTQRLREAQESARKQKSELKSEYLDDHPELSESSYTRYGLKKMSEFRWLSQELDPLVAAQKAQLQARQQLISRLRYLSPVWLIEQEIQQLAGSESRRFQNFEMQVANFHIQWLDYFKGFIAKGKALGAEDFKAFPQFRYQEPSLPPPIQSTTYFILLFSACFIWGSYRISKEQL